jgi:hypothetical protein
VRLQQRDSLYGLLYTCNPGQSKIATHYSFHFQVGLASPRISRRTAHSLVLLQATGRKFPCIFYDEARDEEKNHNVTPIKPF